MRIVFGLVISYLMAAPLTELISLDMTQTHWGNILTYVIWMFSGVIWLFIIFVGGAVFSLIVLGVCDYIEKTRSR